MKFYLKNAFIPFFYLMFTALTSFSISMIGNGLLWLKYVLSILNIGLYGTVITMTSFKDGQIAYGVRQTNDKDREIIVQTGEYRELRLTEEYKPWKGFVHGALACIPLVLLLLIHTIAITSDPTNIMVGRVAGFIYMTFYAPFSFGTVVTGYTFYYALFSIPFIIGFAGIPYVLGARKAEKNYAKAYEMSSRIYGDKK